ncbi:MAG: ABC transporter permease [Eubacteriales bacterium]|nr:ABC transporter permease [Clostridiales bacterium]MDD6931827.1 ABC transporter permease [Eubacteriales bacterium]MDY2601138.1 ABC transporter permease [Eubacteriales bacterium]
MLQYIVKRTLVLIPLLLALSIVVFIIIQLPPGDYLTTYINQLRSTGMEVTEDQIKALEARYGFDQPMYIQYLKWMKNLLKGDMGYSFVYNRPVNALVGSRLPATIAISLVSTILIWLIAFPIGFYSATHKYSFGDYAFTGISFFGVSVPEFLLAILIMYLYFLVTRKYAGGLYSDVYAGKPWTWDKIVDMLKHVWIPLLVIAITGTAGLFKTFRANLLDELGKPYVKTARAKGVSNMRLLIKYPVRIALIPFIATVGWMLPGLISGQTVLSMVLSLPTVGPLLITALQNQDMYLAGSIVFVMGLMAMIGTLVSDILLAVTDPRIRNSM